MRANDYLTAPEPAAQAMDPLEAPLRSFASSAPDIICVGNPMRGDDGFGPAVAARLEGDRVFDGGAVPEDVLPKVEALRPASVIFVDAADFGGTPGELRLVLPEELAAGNLSTHTASLSLSAEYLARSCGARSALLAAQPGTTRFGSVMTVPMVRAVERAAELLRRVL